MKQITPTWALFSAEIGNSQKLQWKTDVKMLDVHESDTISHCCKSLRIYGSVDGSVDLCQHSYTAFTLMFMHYRSIFTLIDLNFYLFFQYFDISLLSLVPLLFYIFVPPCCWNLRMFPVCHRWLTKLNLPLLDFVSRFGRNQWHIFAGCLHWCDPVFAEIIGVSDEDLWSCFAGRAPDPRRGSELQRCLAPMQTQRLNWREGRVNKKAFLEEI